MVPDATAFALHGAFLEVGVHLYYEFWAPRKQTEEERFGRSEETPKEVISRYELRVGRGLLSRFPSDGGVRSTGPGVVSLEPLVVQDVATKFLASVQLVSFRE